MQRMETAWVSKGEIMLNALMQLKGTSSLPYQVSLLLEFILNEMPYQSREIKKIAVKAPSSPLHSPSRHHSEKQKISIQMPKPTPHSNANR